ncbi:phospholipase D-like domain-containing protein [Paraurantiacibacter namhicola]|uniref:Phospholipase D n=1 Tax=Paraurantiacibacter namhicola TaxID=645517 RepID=A0A1C7D4N2_9SPHN|nr:phosphatidylserine/phosphatidylglycerophosphate/cardiolipin synthase family protein [Paraurantiacibacter namhicola]ANU06418.1 Major cardiolipin synthase ClsA [Paraurantiacibacter namhicola]
MADSETTFDYSDMDPFSAEAQGQSLTFYPAGKDRRAALLELVKSARTSLKVVFYIYAEDGIGEELRDALAEAAERGVDTVLLVDGFGAEASEQFFDRLKRAGGSVCRFSPRRTQRYLIRNHQKMVIVDDERAMFGGFNIEDDYFAPPEENGWNDIGIRLEGSAVEGLVDWFGRLKDWTDDDEAHFRAIRKTVKEWEWGEGVLRWLVGGPTRGLSTWARCVSEDLMRGKRLDMFMAYFSPPKRLLKRIGDIADRGEARLLMAGKSDNNATLGATRSLYDYLLKRGSKIWEFRPCKLHTKLVVLDDIVYVGSANFDMRSLYLNLEVMLRIEDADLAAKMREFLDHQIAASKRITPEEHAKRATLWNRFRWNLGWLLCNVMDYTVSRRLNLGL